MHPLCQYGFHCTHEFYDEDGDSFCAYPFTHTKPPKKKKDWNQVSNALLCDQTFYDCPLNDEITIFSRIEKMFDCMCPMCDGTGKRQHYYEASGTSELLKCRDCDGTGNKTDKQREEEQEYYDKVMKRMEEKRALRESKEGASNV
jgi:hypothetical protein